MYDGRLDERDWPLLGVAFPNLVRLVPTDARHTHASVRLMLEKLPRLRVLRLRNRWHRGAPPPVELLRPGGRLRWLAGRRRGFFADANLVCVCVCRENATCINKRVPCVPRTGEADHDPAWMLINRRVLVAQHSFQKPTDGQRFSAGAVVILPRDDHDDDHDDDGDNYASSGSGSGSGGGGGDDHAQGERKETAVATVHGTTTTATTTHFALTCPETGAHMRTARLRASIRLAALAQLVSMNRKCTIGFGWLAPLCDRRLFAVTPDCRVGSPRQADDDDPNETPPLRACYCTAPERVLTRI
jgi:hypothetical protein